MILILIVQIYNIIFKFPNNFKKKKIKKYEKVVKKFGNRIKMYYLCSTIINKY